MGKYKARLISVVFLIVITISYPITIRNELFDFPLLNNDFKSDGAFEFENTSAIDFEDFRIDKGERNNSLPMRALLLPKITPVNFEITNWSWQNVSQAIGLSNLHNMGYYGQNIKIGIIDNGIDFLNPILENVTHIKKSFAEEGSSSTKTHGTVVAGIISGVDDNFPSSPNVTIYSAEMGSTTSDDQIIGNITAAFEWLISEDVDIINTSWGGPSIYWDEVFEDLNKNNITIIGSAGNEGQEGIPSGPGGNTNGISVGSIDNNYNISSFSSVGNALNFDAKPDLVTFGEDLLTANVGLGTTIVSGTSFSAAIVSGALSVLLSALEENSLDYNPGLIKSALLKTATDLGYPSEQQGAGLFNVSKAFEIIRDGEKLDNVITLTSIRSGMNAPEMNNLPSGLNLNLPITLVSSHPENTKINILGNLSSVINSIQPSQYSENVIYLDSIQGKFIGKIDFILGNLTESLDLQIEILTPVRKIIAIDWYYNQYLYSGISSLRMTNPFVTMLRNEGYWVEGINGPIQFIDQNRYDLIWIEDPFRLNNGPETSSPSFTIEDKEILDNLVNDGKAIFVSYFGLYSNEIDLTNTFGTNMTSVNSLLSLWSIEGKSEPTYVKTLPLGREVNIINSSSYGKMIHKLEISGQDLVGGITLLENSRSIIASDQIDQGRVVVSSSINWKDELFTLQLIEWMTNDLQVKMSKLNIEDNRLNITVQLYNSENDVPVLTETQKLRLEMIHTSFSNSVNSTYILPTLVNDQYNFYINLGTYDEGLYDWLITYENNIYIKSNVNNSKQLIIDREFPTINLVSNITINKLEITKEMVFSTHDNHGIDRIEVYYNGSQINQNRYSYSEISKELVINVKYDDISIIKSKIIFVNVIVLDIAGNVANAIGFIDITDFTNGESSQEITSTESSTTLKYVTSNRFEDGDKLDISYIVVIALGILSVFGFVYLRKFNLQQEKERSE